MYAGFLPSLFACRRSLWKKCCFSGDGEYIVAGAARQHSLYIWEKSSGNLVKFLLGTKGEMLLDVVVSFLHCTTSVSLSIFKLSKFAWLHVRCIQSCRNYNNNNNNYSSFFSGWAERFRRPNLQRVLRFYFIVLITYIIIFLQHSSRCWSCILPMCNDLHLWVCIAFPTRVINVRLLLLLLYNVSFASFVWLFPYLIATVHRIVTYICIYILHISVASC